MDSHTSKFLEYTNDFYHSQHGTLLGFLRNLLASLAVVYSLPYESLSKLELWASLSKRGND